MNNDFYLTHIYKEKEIQKIATKKNIITIEPSQICTYTHTQVFKEYYAKINDVIIFGFTMITTDNPISTKGKKDETEYLLNTEEEMENFVIKMQNFAIKISNDYYKIYQNFYINDYSLFQDEIYLKIKLFSNKKYNPKIKINLNNYLLQINEVNLISFDTLSELMESKELVDLKKDFLHSLLYFLKIW